MFVFKFQNMLLHGFCDVWYTWQLMFLRLLSMAFYFHSVKTPGCSPGSLSGEVGYEPSSSLPVPFFRLLNVA